MRRELTYKSATIVGASDLTIIAPIRKGFVPSLDAITYKTRVKRVLKTLHLGRATSHEYEIARVLSDAVERVGRIHSIRIAILEPEDKVMLAVTFDGSWESYIRVIWQKVARSLDLVFCNTEAYVNGWENSFEAWCVWLREHQAETPFLYSPPGLTYQDTQYLRMFENRFRRNGNLAEADLETTRIRIPTAEQISDDLSTLGTDPTNLGANPPLGLEEVGPPTFRQGMRALAGLYRLAEVYRPGTGDGKVLHRAATELLREFLPVVGDAQGGYQDAIEFAERRFKDALDWLRDGPPSPRGVPALPDEPARDEWGDVQGGIVRAYPGTSDGCLLMLAFDSAAALGAFLARATPTKETDVVPEGGFTVNVALSLEGLRLAGLSDAEIAALPQEFTQGMERRAGMLGDVRVNHPRRWRRPPLNGAEGAKAREVAEDDPCPRADLSAVHLVLQLRLRNDKSTESDARQLLWKKYQSLANGEAAVRLLSVQWMHRLLTPQAEVREHFGYLDSVSEPSLDTSGDGVKYRNRIHLGEILVGHANAADKGWPRDDASPTRQLLRNGSFLVVRKLRQDIGALDAVLDAAADADHPRELLMAKMMGRWPLGSAQAGEPLAKTGSSPNDFNFRVDQGEQCPFHAHIRVANPRQNAAEPGARPPRLIRRGMSYGPPHDPKATGEQREASLREERGLVFMAYNASIGEQFEVVQRWLAGANGSGSYSGQSDPFLGVAESGRPRVFRFEDEAGKAVHLQLDGSFRAHEEPRPIVRLEWGMYLFAPSLSALDKLARRASQAGDTFAKSWSVERGHAEIEDLRQIEATQGADAAFVAWKEALEDPTAAAEFTSASIWAAIRERGGVLRTPFGVLVASRELVDHVLHDREGNLTATGYLPRMERSFGPLYLGMDAGRFEGTYERESEDVNRAIMKLTATKEDFDAAVSEAARLTRGAIEQLALQAIARAVRDGERHWDVTIEAREIIDEVLATFCEQWFGLSAQPGSGLLRRGVRFTWDDSGPPSYPGHFMAPSRYTFQPHPNPEVERIGANHGFALRKALTTYLAQSGEQRQEPVARAILDSKAAKLDAGYPARTLAGVLMGFLPTTDGNMRRILNEWLNEGTLWSLRAQAAAVVDATDVAAADAALGALVRQPFIRAMQLRAAPELLWRTAVRSHAMGPRGSEVTVQPGDIVIASLISATQQCLESGDDNVTHAFGGHRGAAGHPVHACPGYGPAMAVMKGFLMGLVGSTQSLRPGPGPLTLTMEGYVTLPESRASRLERPAHDGREAFMTNAAAVTILTLGDSWAVLHSDNNSRARQSLSTALRGFDYVPRGGGRENEFCDVGMKLSTLVRMERMLEYVAAMDGEKKPPRAILLSAGGNDLVQPTKTPRTTELFRLLNPGAQTPDAALNPEAMHLFVRGENGLMGNFRKLLTALTRSTRVPILLHGYDHPHPDGRGVLPGDLLMMMEMGLVEFPDLASWFRSGPWLKKVFEEAGVAEAVRRPVMRLLIDELNAMLADIAAEFPGQVHHVPFAGELAKQADYAQDYTKYWANELHATKAGFQVLGKMMADKLAALGVK